MGKELKNVQIYTNKGGKVKEEAENWSTVQLKKVKINHVAPK